MLTVDGVGEWATLVVRVAGHQVRPLEEMHFPNSLGLLYSAFTYFTGFKVNSGNTRSWASPPMASRATSEPSSIT